jgi:hypothetical protein
VLLQYPGKGLAGKLGALVGVEDIWPSLLERFFQGLGSEIST